MIRNFETVEDLNLYYARVLKELGNSENSKNVNDSVLQCMLEELMRDYNLNLEIINLKLSFAKKIYIRERKFEQKSDLLDFKFRQKKKKVIYNQNKKRYRELLKSYKKQRNDISKKSVETAKEQIKTELLSEFNLLTLNSNEDLKLIENTLNNETTNE